VIIAGKSPIIGSDEIMALVFGDGGQIVFPEIGENVVGSSLIKPLDLRRTTEKNPPQDQPSDAIRVGLGVC
jgi:hypothetical protein